MNENEHKPTIRILPDFIANQIAAGEVVQRPESVIKELVENAMDAGADTIVVVVRDAGKSLMHVVDNGYGMSRADLELSIKRHATSKIYSADDLERIRTYGFRGEALASISSVANIEIRTKRAADTVGWKLTAEPNKEQEIMPGGAENGTQVFVRNLFYNTPARRKFLKSNLTEFRHISTTMMKFAIINPDKRFTFYDGDNLIFDFHPQKVPERIIAAMGREFESALMRVKSLTDEIKISGYIAEPHLARQSRSGQFLYLNRRSISSRMLSHAIFTAFERLIDKGLHPVYMINLEIDPERVDINVHPQKQEVKFDNEKYIYDLLHKAAAEALQNHALIPGIEFEEQVSSNPIRAMKQSEGGETILVNRQTGEIVDPGNSKRPDLASNESFRSGPPEKEFRHFDNERRGPVSDQEMSAFDALFGKSEKGSPNTALPRRIENQEDKRSFQLGNKFIAIISRDSLLLLDQQESHRRILYEKALKTLKSGKGESQELLFAESVKLNPAQTAALKEIEKDLQKIGFYFKRVDEATLSLVSVPVDIKSGEEVKTFIEVIENFESGAGPDDEKRKEKMARAFSVRAAVKTGDKLNAEEMNMIFDNLGYCENPNYGPDGNPTRINLSLEDLNKLFNRKKS